MSSCRSATGLCSACGGPDARAAGRRAASGCRRNRRILRRSFDGLCALVASHLGENPASGRWYVFINRRRTMVKVLGFEHGGFFIWSKRLEQGLFASPRPAGSEVAVAVADRAFGASGGDRHHRPAPPQALRRPACGGVKPPRRGGRDIGGQRIVGEQRLPPPRRQLIDPAGRVGVDAQQDVGQPDAGVRRPASGRWRAGR